MKKDRNCSNNFPVYPTYPMPGMLPGIPQMNGVMPYTMDMSSMNNINYSQNNGSIEQQLSSLNSQINSLERRVSNLENIVGNNNNYNTTNYQML